jgi:hypothetical protein
MNKKTKKGQSNKQSILMVITLVLLAVAGIVLFNYFRDQFYGRVCQDNLRSLDKGLEKYIKKNHAFPKDIRELSKYGVPARAFHCPYDAPGKVSYGFNEAFLNKNFDEIGQKEIAIADSSLPVFSSYKDFAYRHKNGADKYAYVILKDKTVFLYKQPDDQKNSGLLKNKGISNQECWNQYNQKLSHCRALKISDSYYSQCPNDALNQYNQCISQ